MLQHCIPALRHRPSHRLGNPLVETIAAGRRVRHRAGRRLEEIQAHARIQEGRYFQAIFRRREEAGRQGAVVVIVMMVLVMM